METKLFEVRDRMTFIAVIAIRLEPGCEADRYLLASAGYGLTPSKQRQYVLMGKVRDGRLMSCAAEHDGYPQVRTMWVAHQYMAKHWDDLNSGQLIDVEYLLGETEQPVESQRREIFPFP